MVRRRREDIHVNHERWLVSYADFITLLFAFFVVMYSISQVSDSKYRVLSDTFIEAFNQPTNSQTNAEPSEQLNPSNSVIAPIEMGKAAQPNLDENPVPGVIGQAGTAQTTDPTATENVPTSDELTQISDLVSEKFSQLIKDQMITVSSNELWLQIELKD